MHVKTVIMIVLFSTFAFGQPPHHRLQRIAGHLSSLEHLKTWADEYPVSGKRNIFKDPALHRALLNLLGDADYQRLIEDFSHSAPIEIIDGYFVMHSVVDTSNPRQEIAFVAFWMYYDVVFVAFKSQFGAEWRIPKNEIRDMPMCVMRMVNKLGPWSPLIFEE